MCSIDKFINLNMGAQGAVLILLVSSCVTVSLGSMLENNTNYNANDNYNKENKIEPRSLLTDIARQLISRTGTNSQVLSLNLTNLIILLILKGLLFGAALVGSETLKGRSLNQNIHENLFKYDSMVPTKISETELSLFISYLMGETTENYECLKRVACNDPKKSMQYLKAGKMFIGVVNSLKDVIPINKKYETLLVELENAINFRKSGGKCDERYICIDQNSDNSNTT